MTITYYGNIVHFLGGENCQGALFIPSRGKSIEVYAPTSTPEAHLDVLLTHRRIDDETYQGLLTTLYMEDL